MKNQTSRDTRLDRQILTTAIQGLPPVTAPCLRKSWTAEHKLGSGAYGVTIISEYNLDFFRNPVDSGERMVVFIKYTLGMRKILTKS